MERAKEIVIDASVAIKWFSQEEGSDRAVELRSDHVDGRKALISPDLLFYEVLNALRFKPKFDSPTVARAINDLLDLRLDIMTPNREIAGNVQNWLTNTILHHMILLGTRRISGFRSNHGRQPPLQKSERMQIPSTALNVAKLW